MYEMKLIFEQMPTPHFCLKVVCKRGGRIFGSLRHAFPSLLILPPPPHYTHSKGETSTTQFGVAGGKRTQLEASEQGSTVWLEILTRKLHLAN